MVKFNKQRSISRQPLAFSNQQSAISNNQFLIRNLIQNFVLIPGYLSLENRPFWNIFNLKYLKYGANLTGLSRIVIGTVRFICTLLKDETNVNISSFLRYQEFDVRSKAGMPFKIQNKFRGSFLSRLVYILTPKILFHYLRLCKNPRLMKLQFLLFSCCLFFMNTFSIYVFLEIS